MRGSTAERSQAGAPARPGRRTAGGALALGTVLLASLALAAPAAATKTHLFKETFGSAAQPTTVTPGPVAIDPATGDLLVVDLGEAAVNFNNGALRRYKPNGEPDPFAALGTNVIDGREEPTATCTKKGQPPCKPCPEEPASCDATPQNGFKTGLEGAFGVADQVQVVVDRSGTATDGDIYVTQARARLIDIFAEDGRYLGQLTKSGTSGPKFEEPEGVAVDESGNVYVSDRPSEKIFVYEPTANPPTNASFKEAIETVGKPEDLAAGAGPSAGSLFVVKHAGSVQEFAGGLYKLKLPGGELEYPILEGLLGNEAVTAIAVDPASGHLFVLRHNGPPQVLKEYDASGPSHATLLSTTDAFGASPTGPFGSPTGVAANGDVYVPYVFRESGLEGGRVEVLGAPIVTLPAATTEEPSAIGPTRATLKGTVNPDGVPLEKCFFEYVRGSDYEEKAPNPYAKGKTAPCEGAVPADSSDHAVQAKVTELLPSLEGNQTYHFRLVAANAGGAGHTVHGADQQFSTPNVVKAEPPSEIGETSATLNATVNPDGAPVTECKFEYGTTTAYGSVVPCAEISGEIGEGEAPVPVHADIAGLSPATQYFWRVRAATVGSGSGGTGVAVGSPFETSEPHPVITEPASEIAATAATLNGTVDPGGAPVTECKFEYGTTTAYGSVAPCAESEAEIGTGEAPVPVHADIAGLAPATVYHFRLIASPGSGEDKSFKTLGPLVDAEWTSSVTTTEATLKAQINPEGQPTTYRLEYGRTAAPFEHATAESDPIGSGSADVTVSVSLEGLQAGTTYRYRFVATNADYSTAGAEATFNTYRPPLANATCPNQALRAGPGAALPDCRAYELVSPLEKSGDAKAEIAQATPDGAKFTYISAFTAFGNPESSPSVSRYLATRGPGAGWSSRSISAPRSTIYYYWLLKFFADMYKAFTPDLCQGWVLGDTDRLLSPDAAPGFPNLYRRDLCGEGGYQALTTAPPPDPAYAETDKYWPTLQGFSADGGISVFYANAPLTLDAAPLTPDALKDNETQLYAADESGALHLLSVLPDGSPAAGVRSSLGLAAVAGSNETSNEDNVRHAVSEDGSLVYWTASEQPGPGTLYLRLNPTQPQSAIEAGECTEAAKACTVPVSEALPGGDKAKFQTAAADGSAAFFTAGRDFYEFNAARAIAHEAGATRLIAKKVAGVMGASEDASRVYFFSNEACSDEANGAGEVAEPGANNLYLYEAGESCAAGELAFVGKLSGGDFDQLDQILSPTALKPSIRTSRISPDGLHAAFTSAANLTGYDNTDAASGHADAEVYLYDAESGELRCASCNPGGARPVGRKVSGVGKGGPVAIWAAALIPGWQNEQQPSRALSENGKRLFFESYGALLLTDTNGAPDVYQWEAPGEGGCDSEDADYFPSNGGCVSLISSGKSPQASEFADASADGSDVFFGTGSSLVAADPGLRDVYDARVEGGFPEPQPAAACEGEACQNAPEAPNDPTPGSSSFEGPGNVHEGKAPKKPSCAKGKTRRKGHCIAKKRHHRRHAGHNRRGAL